MHLPFEHPMALLLLPLTLLPWFSKLRYSETYPSLPLLPADPVSDGLSWTLKLFTTVLIACTILGIATPYYYQQPEEHVGRGAEILILLDRSLSMDQSFVGRPASSGRTGVDAASGGESKGTAARRLLAEFALRRTHDLMAMMAFTTLPIRVTGFSDRQEVVQGAIAAANVGHGIADTNMGQALVAALGMFHDQPYNGSRVILLVSDGGAHLDSAVQQRVSELMRQERVALYWLYLRTRRSPGLMIDRDVTAAEAELVPEHFLHQYFSTMGAPYHAYEAENPDALASAIADIDQLQSQPIRFQSPVIRHDLTGSAYRIAFVAALLLAFASVLEWRRQ